MSTAPEPTSQPMASESASPTARHRRPRPGVATNLRTAALWESVSRVAEDLQADIDRPLRVLDLGGGTGGVAVALATLGHQVTVVDPSPDALAALGRRAEEAGVADRIIGIQGDSSNLDTVHPQAQADLVCCHGVLEFVDDPARAVRALAGALAPDGVLSLVVAQRLSVVLARALAGQFGQAQHALTTPEGRWGPADPLPRRFDRAAVCELVEEAGLEVIDTHGVRIFSDFVPSAFVDSEAERQALLDLERAASSHPDFAVLAELGASLHVLAGRH
ncbi:methyltransferase domain-containing protein [Arsenicicoccus piscis]|uniref:methyltransferase domain-containing protein n=1 Tax=Arsenicicoccus piscis TaxID=673954 RepID=UPI001F4C5BD6|nr:methyltransferase domain-containing protein [Arsenicicoccus piscis]MCH8628622.1 methyltransferase domain-containing protein [Arsenicicoccus piscis]